MSDELVDPIAGENRGFYDRMARFYHLIYPDWEASIEEQARRLDRVIQSRGWRAPATILDATCGIGTQVLGLAALGYEVVGSDYSQTSVERARHEAHARGIDASFCVADIRRVHDSLERRFDVVISCDNAISHIKPEDLPVVLAQLHRSAGERGLCIIGVRTWLPGSTRGQEVSSCTRRADGDKLYFLFQSWDEVEGRLETRQYIVEDDRRGSCTTEVMPTAFYYSLTADELAGGMEQAGFADISIDPAVDGEQLVIGLRPHCASSTA